MLEESTLTCLDWAIVGASLAVSVSIGLYFANKNKTFTDYATGGGNQNLLAVSVSTALAYCSALTMVGNSSEQYLHGSSYAITMSTAIFGWPVSALILLPVFKRLNNVSVFEYLEKRFDRKLRLFASLVFLSKMIFYTAITLYLPSLSLQAILQIPSTISIGITGVICVICSTFGGLKGITWTNAYHSVLLVLTMIIILVGGTVKAGGLSTVWNDGISGDRLSPGKNYFKFDLETRHSFFNTFLSYFMVRIFLHGVGQGQVQSALSLSTLRRSQLSELLSAIIYFLIQALASACGLVMYSQYKNCDPFESGDISRRDAILMHYLSTNLNYIPALQGLFIATVFSATFSSFSAFQSSCSAMIIEDFVRPAFKCKKRIISDNLGAKLGKLVSFILGVTCISLTFQMHKIDGLIQATTYIFSVCGIPILMAFLLGMLTRFCNATGAFAGMLCSLLVGLNFLIYRLSYGPNVVPSLELSTLGCNETVANPYANLLLGNSTLHSMMQNSTLLNRREDASSENENDDDDLVEISMSLEIVEEDLPLEQVLSLRPGNHDNILLRISYLWTPLVIATTSVVVSTVVSLLTGGASQVVDERHLSSLLHRCSGDIYYGENAAANGSDYDTGKVKAAVTAKEKSLRIVAV